MALCPRKAIVMQIERRRGIYLPCIDESACNACGICVEVCPGHEVNFAALNEAAFGRQPDDKLLGNYFGCYTGHATDENVRYNSSSGGMVSALLIYALENGIINGALVTRMNPAKPLEPQPFIARTKEEILSASGSKYCFVPANIALAEILKAEESEKFAMVGLPCHMHGLRKAELSNKKLRERVALRVGLFCSNTNVFQMTEYIIGKQKIKLDQVSKLDYRGNGWPGEMRIQFGGNKERKIPYEDYIKYHQFGFFTTRRCTLCSDLTSEFADISFGDAWLEKGKDKAQSGLSMAIVRSDSGQEVFTQALQGKSIRATDYEPSKALRSAGNKRANLAARKKLNKLIGKPTPEYGEKAPRPSLRAYPYYLVVYFNSWVSSKKILSKFTSAFLNTEIAIVNIVRFLRENFG
jgi:coenzyme F420 hydrogenase subunit beta